MSDNPVSAPSRRSFYIASIGFEVSNHPVTRTRIAEACMAVADAENAALTATIEDLKDALDAMFNERCERDAEIKRLTYDRNHPYGEAS